MPTCLILPGLNGSGRDHWQSRWLALRDDCEKVEFGCWQAPERAVWIARLDEAVEAAVAPVFLVAHSLGCHAVAWWAAGADPADLAKVSAAMLVAPPDLGHADLQKALRPFAPPSRAPLPFPGILVASRDDPYSAFETNVELAATWGLAMVDAGPHGHLNAASGLGDWGEGQRLLDRLIRPPPERQDPTRTRSSTDA